MKTTTLSEKNKDFFAMVYEVVKQIPAGRVCSYGVIGAYLGAARSARMVGWAMNNAHNISGNIPAHRVVNKQGILSGKHHFKDPNLMEELLEKEGIIVENDQIVNFEKHFWDPFLELENLES